MIKVKTDGGISMTGKIALLTQRMIGYEGDCVKRVNHFLTVYAFAKTIGELEGLDDATLFTLSTAALVHDVGIRASLAKLGHYDAGLQQEEGPPVAREMLRELDFPADVIERVCYLVSRHHTYTDIEGLDYQILVEADFLVNIFGKGMCGEQLEAVRKNIFKTRAGLTILRSMYGKL